MLMSEMGPALTTPTTVEPAYALPIPIAGPGAEALATLTPAQKSFIRVLPKAELHAHLNGSIPLAVLQELAREHIDAGDDAVRDGLARLAPADGVVRLAEIGDFFGLFPAIYALTADPAALARATRAVLRVFVGPPPPSADTGGEPSGAQCAYLELRTTPRATPAMTRAAYVETVLGEVERYGAERAALIVSLDRRMGEAVAEEVVEIAARARREGRRVVGVDLCGDPMVGV
jgi:adenosine deaminase